MKLSKTLARLFCIPADIMKGVCISGFPAWPCLCTPGLWFSWTLCWRRMGNKADESEWNPISSFWHWLWAAIGGETGCYEHSVWSRICVLSLQIRLLINWMFWACHGTPKTDCSIWAFCTNCAGVRLILLSILNAKFENFLVVIGLVCSSWVTVSSGTHYRSPWFPLGIEEHGFVSRGNQMTSRCLTELISCTMILHPL